MKLKFFSVVMLLAWPNLSSAKIDPAIHEQLSRKVEKLRQSGKTPGTSVVTFTSSGIQWAYGLGVADQVHGSPINVEKSIFPVSSVSKIVTALAVHQLVQSGRISLEHTLDQFPSSLYFKTVNERCPSRLPNLRRIRINDLLNHSSGLGHDLVGVDIWWTKAGISDGVLPTEKDFQDHFCKDEYLYPAGQIPGGAKYSNLGFNLLGQIVEAVTGKSLPAYVAENIFHLLGMKNSFYQVPLSRRSDLVTTYGKPGSQSPSDSDARTIVPKVYEVGSYAGSIGLTTSAFDLALLGTEILGWTSARSRNQLNLDWKNILRPELSLDSASLTLAGGFFVLLAKSGEHSRFRAGVLCYGHTGTHYGVRAMVYACPELDWGIAVMSNARDAKRNEYLFELGQILFESNLMPSPPLPPATTDWLRQIREFQAAYAKPTYFFPEQVERRLSTDSSSFEDYLGTYHSEIDGRVEIKLGPNGKLVFLGAELYQDKFDKDLFYNGGFDLFGHVGESVHFQRNSRGQITKIVAYGILHATKVN